MDRRSEFVSQLTNFPPLSPEDSDSGVAVLLSKFFNFSRPVPVESAPQEASAPQEVWRGLKEPLPDEAPEEETGESSSLQNVLKKLSSLVALKSTGVARYADTEHARYWMPDHVSRECYECGARFSAFRRRHHCRVCGQIFCARCCSHRVPGHVCGCAGGLRVCTHCCHVVLGYLHTTGGEMLTEDLSTLQDNLKEKIPKVSERPMESGFLQETRVDGESAEERAHQHSLHDIFLQLCKSLPLQHQRYRLIRYPGVWRGGDILQWLQEQRYVSTSGEALSVCQSLLSEGLLECVTEQTSFTDYTLYKPVNPPSQAASDPGGGSSEMIGSTSSYILDLNLAESSARLVRGPKKVFSDVSETSDYMAGNASPSETESGDESRPCCPSVEAAGAERLRLLLVQGLARAGLSLTWAAVLLPLCLQTANMISLDVDSSEWDIRRCVRVKRVAGGSVRECGTAPGVVFSKNVAHRGMATNISSPRVLLLNCSISYQRVEGKLVSLEPVIMQEEEYLRQCCERILSLEPDLLLVAGGVARLAQEQLRARGVALALGVRSPVLRRVARACRADVLNSVDAHVARTPPRLGTCKAFYLLNYESKTLMVLEGYPKDLKCCSIILRGAPLEELGRVKKVTSLVLLAAYNWRLESSLLGDMGATLPVSGTSLMFTDNSEGNTPEDNESIQGKISDQLVESASENHLCKEEDLVAECKEAEEAEDQKDCMKIGLKEESTIREFKLTVAKTDPLTSERSALRKPDPALSCGIAVDDFSDPLRSNQLLGDDEVFLPRCEGSQLGEEDMNTLRDRWGADECVLSLSPGVRVVAPYLESEAGRRCPLRPFYCMPLFPSPPIPRTPPYPRKPGMHQPPSMRLKEPHPLISEALVQSAEGISVRTLLANFRANGGRLQPDSFKLKVPSPNKAVGAEKEDPAPREAEKLPADPLDPEKHQRMYLLYYSYCSRSTNAPDFCVNPWIVRMDMYGNNDIPLGLFLERHCFNPQTACTSPSCQVPLMQHVRKFVHGDGCITVTCGTVESSATRGPQHHLTDEEEGKQPVMWWCRCVWCRTSGTGGGGACVRAPSLALSLAKYLELRLHAPRYTRARSCQHSLNQQHAHYFARYNTTACFRYSKIKSWDICLPPASIATHHNTRTIREGLINQINDLALKGHEIFSTLAEGEAEKEQAAFKQHVEQIQIKLTSSSLHVQPNGASVVRWLWGISDALVIGEKLLQDALEKWTTQTPSKTPFKLTQDIVDGKIETEDNSQPDFNAVDCAADNKGMSGNSTDTGEEEEDKSDKRGLRAMLSQLLNSSQPAHQNGVVLCGGVVPLIVRGSEVSSLAAAALASHHYQLVLQTAPNCVPSEQDDSKEKAETEGKSKNSKYSEHIDVQLQDGLCCRVFHARQFLKLRAMLLCPLDSNCHITNHFNLKPAEGNDISDGSTNKEEIVVNQNCEMSGVVQKEKLSSVPERDVTVSVESSPVMGLKRNAEEKAKRSSQQKSGALEPLTDVEEGFIRSLSRCVPWAARGGKSGSTFCKTTDDRHILKEMSKLELQLFLDLAPHYFNHIQSCHQNKLPTLLGRIVGVYRVDGVGGVGGGVLVMENLWHGRPDMAQRFDLKGAQRNRLAHQGPPDNVLLDENLLNLRWERPLYVQSHSAGVLWAAVQRDTAFLAAHHIMDYSLLVGLDEERQELVLGIIDYIRTFTWDKKLEHIVKKGLGSGLPTIVSPEQYKTRFCIAMKKYFLQSPNQWEDLHRGLLSASK